MSNNAQIASADIDDLGLEVPPGGSHYRAYVGPPADYDLISAMAFNLLTHLGLRQNHRLLDIGCGSLRIGRLLIPYLNRNGYTGIEPNAWLVEDGIACEVGHSQLQIKGPRFVIDDSAQALIDEGATFRFVLAQSILSHCGPDLFDRWLQQSLVLMESDGALVATYVASDSDNALDGWIYPHCVGYTEARIRQFARDAGLHAIPLTWHHPRQRWVVFARNASLYAPLSGVDLSWNHCYPRIDPPSH